MSVMVTTEAAHGDARDEPAGPPARPLLTITEAARAAGKDRRTVRRWLQEGRLAGANQVDGRWLIPVEGLLGAGVHLYGARPPAGPPDGERPPGGVLDTLREELAAAQARAREAEARARMAEALADERRRALDDLRLAPRALAPGPPDQPPAGPPEGAQPLRKPWRGGMCAGEGRRTSPGGVGCTSARG